MNQLDSPILIIDDDEDDNLLLQLALQEMQPGRPLRFFDQGESVLAYLRTTQERPFLIISEVKLPGMDGLELRQAMDEDQTIRERSIPFVFMSFPVLEQSVANAYQMTVQGYFEKPQRASELRAALHSIIDYWSRCRHPNQT